MAKKKRATKKDTAKKVVRRRQSHAKPKEMIDPKTGELLNPKHEIFAQMWVQTFDKRKAIEEAGYAKGKTTRQVNDTARGLLRREEVQTRVRSILRERVQDFAVTTDWVVLEMLDVIQKGKTEVPIMGKGDDGPEIVGYDYADLRTATTALIKLGENLGMFQKKDDKPVRNVQIINNYGDGAEPKRIGVDPIEGHSKRLN